MLNVTFLNFLENPSFVIPWYLVGAIAAIWVVWDVFKVNTRVNTALKYAWPIIMIFFSVIGLALYLITCRPPGIGKKKGKDEIDYHHRYVSAKWKKVTGSVMHCVAGDGLGIMTAMVISRMIDLNFWPEFWFEYAVGFLFGWFIFQFIAMRKMADSTSKALWLAGRAEFFSMITVMVGMGLVMRFVTPEIAGLSPNPDTFTFWGFGALGLFVGAIFTFPMNWWLVSIGWKHGMS
ncbi:DUF4396 domain-containing protein [Prolixibacter sp. NT017]|uniref:DUF4396 domain-containing protein n=1 Tax=Prolixibacter sp. NT017 TaxID=2652390 RepID=UPI0012769F80|nr:DUF4396 domain-containing protein [Prolixibacter sp. NT017]GET25857.1 hypothetical protein NT017_21860 [Prolixibacter sp. NT017]